MIEIRKTEVFAKWIMNYRTSVHVLASLSELKGYLPGIQVM